MSTVDKALQGTPSNTGHRTPDIAGGRVDAGLLLPPLVTRKNADPIVNPIVDRDLRNARAGLLDLPKDLDIPPLTAGAPQVPIALRRGIGGIQALAGQGMSVQLVTDTGTTGADLVLARGPGPGGGPGHVMTGPHKYCRHSRSSCEV
jgi:hypothetical protein